MKREYRHGVEIERCLRCGGLWFDIDEIHEYLAAHPGVPDTHRSTVGDFKPLRPDDAATCPCCGEPALHGGSFKEIDYRRCSWCGGIFIAAGEIDAIVRSRRAAAPGPPPIPLQAVPPSETIMDRVAKGISDFLRGGAEIIWEDSTDGDSLILPMILGLVYDAVIDMLDNSLDGH
jgi:Zn-finger nucleic acid-binding protein